MRNEQLVELRKRNEPSTQNGNELSACDAPNSRISEEKITEGTTNANLPHIEDVSENRMRAEQAVAATEMELQTLATEVDALTKRLDEVMEHLITYFPSGLDAHLFST